MKNLTNNNMKYKDIADLGFKRTDSHDQVVFNEIGVHPFYCDYDLTKSISLNYGYGNDYVRLLRCDKEGTIKGEIKLYEISEVKEVIKFFKNK